MLDLPGIPTIIEFKNCRHQHCTVNVIFFYEFKILQKHEYEPSSNSKHPNIVINLLNYN